MGFGQGNTGTIVALIVALSSGLAFVICFREFIREIFATSIPRLDKSLRRHRNVLLDEGGEFVVDDEIFHRLVENQVSRWSNKDREWRDPSTYIMTIGFLGLVAAAGFVAGLSHFT